MFVETLWNRLPQSRQDLKQIADRDGARDDVESWATALNISDDWFITGALWLVEAWQQYPESDGVIWQWAPRALILEWESPRCWNPLMETERDFDDEIARYKSRIRARAAELGLRSSPNLRRPDHFQWLVEHQVLRRTYAEIAATYRDGLGESSVGQAITGLAAEIGLTLRTAPLR
jgi:hypothetical protein